MAWWAGTLTSGTRSRTTRLSLSRPSETSSDSSFRYVPDFFPARILFISQIRIAPNVPPCVELFSSSLLPALQHSVHVPCASLRCSALLWQAPGKSLRTYPGNEQDVTAVGIRALKVRPPPPPRKPTNQPTVSNHTLAQRQMLHLRPRVLRCGFRVKCCRVRLPLLLRCRSCISLLSLGGVSERSLSPGCDRAILSPVGVSACLVGVSERLCLSVV